MKITSLKTNHLVNPLGYWLQRPSISYIVEETEAKRQAGVLGQAAGPETDLNSLWRPVFWNETRNPAYSNKG